MSISQAYSAHLIGLTAEIVTVEVDISNGLHAFSVVGLGDRAVEEAKDRVSAAIKNTGYVSPKQKNQKVVISLAPADIRKEGPSFDLAMAVAYLSAAGDLELEYEGKLFQGELSLEGSIRRVNGLLPILIQAAAKGFTTAFVPKDNADEASLARGIIVYAVSSLREVIDHLSRTRRLEPVEPRSAVIEENPPERLDMSLVRGNETAKRGLEIAAAGAHNIILYGPPGTGKTMLAQSFISILPPLSYEQSVEVTGIHSAARALPNGLITRPPFRAPHHTASAISILGGGTSPHPGEITLAHRGVLFMDEFPEFDRNVIDALRQPLEDRVITVARVKGSVTFPAQCLLIASMNPCRCGKGKDNGCTCPPHILEAYRRRISAPILDRIDLWVNVNKVDYEKLAARHSTEESSATIRARVAAARAVQAERFSQKCAEESGNNDVFRKNPVGKKYFNSEMDAKAIENLALLEDDARKLLRLSAERLKFSGRAFHRVIKVARTIADLAGSKTILKVHALEALQYRKKE
jgi:magnesium chelatase family protein